MSLTFTNPHLIIGMLLSLCFLVALAIWLVRDISEMVKWQIKLRASEHALQRRIERFAKQQAQ